MANLEMYRANTKRWGLTVTTNGIAENLTGGLLFFTAKSSPAAADNILQKSIGSGITVTDALGGLATVKLDPADTVGLPDKPTKLSYDVEYQNASGEIYTIASGALTVFPDVTVR